MWARKIKERMNVRCVRGARCFCRQIYAHRSVRFGCARVRFPTRAVLRDNGFVLPVRGVLYRFGETGKCARTHTAAHGVYAADNGGGNEKKGSVVFVLGLLPTGSEKGGRTEREPGRRKRRMQNGTIKVTRRMNGETNAILRK